MVVDLINLLAFIIVLLFNAIYLLQISYLIHYPYKSQSKFISKNNMEDLNNQIQIKQCGFLLFDETIYKKENIKSNIMSGVGCVAGEKPFTFKTIKEIPNNILWLSNLEKDQVWRANRKLIKSKNYLGISFEALHNNFAMSGNKLLTVKTFADLFDKTILMFEYFLGQVGKEQGKIIEFNKKVELSETLYDLFFTKSFTKKTSDINRFKFSEAYIETIKSPNNSKLTGKTYTFSFEPNYYIEELLKETVPVGNWLEVQETFYQLPLKNQIEKLQMDLKANIKSLVKVDYIKFEESFISQGNAYNPAKIWLGTRGWQINGAILDELYLTEKEVIFLSKYAQFKILNVIQNGNCQSLSHFFTNTLFNQKLLLKEENETDGLKRMSFIFQCLNRVFLHTFISTGYGSSTRKKRPFNENMIWLRAREREICFEGVKALKEHSQIEIKRFGNGEISFTFKEKLEDKKALVETLLKNHLVVPYYLANEEIDIKKIKESVVKNNKNNLDLLEYRDNKESKDKIDYNLVDYYLKHKLTKSKGKTQEELLELNQSIFDFINRVAFINEIYQHEEKEQKEIEIKKLIAYLQSLNFTQKDEENEYVAWFLKKVVEKLG